MHNDINWYDITEYKSCNSKWNTTFVKEGERLNMSYKLIVEDYGKIEKAELEIKPLTLFVGDNNSGKSYLLSLIWAIMSERENHLLYRGLKKVLIEKHYDFYSKFLELLENYDFNDENDCVVIEELELENLINDLFALNKDRFVKSIFNYEEMSIGKLKIKINENRRFEIFKEESDTERIKLSLKVDGIRRMDMIFSIRNHIEEIAILSIVRKLIDIIIINDLNMNSTYYLPAARTGFMLAKNIINQVGRKTAFDFVVETEENNNIEMSPLPKPIIHFLDAIDNLNVQFKNENHAELLDWILHNMVNGTVECIDNNSGNIQYIPEGMEKGIPLRATSGVVTELTPLILLLKSYIYSKLDITGKNVNIGDEVVFNSNIKYINSDVRREWI